MTTKPTPHLATESVEGAALALEGVDDVERGDGLALGVLGVGDGVADDALEEGLEDAAGLLVDHCKQDMSDHTLGRGYGRVETRTGRDTLDAATAGETADGGLGDALDIVAQDLAVALGAALAEALTTFATWDDGLFCRS